MRMIRYLFTSTTPMKQVFPFKSPEAANNNNILLLDLTHKHLVELVSGSLNQPYLVPYQNKSKVAVGKLFGSHARPMICLPVQALRRNVGPMSVHFLIDTGSPATFISKKALLTIFDVKDLSLLPTTGVDIWGTKISISQSTAHWEGINLLGANYLRKAQLAFQCIYDQDPELEHCKLEKRA